MLRGEQLTFWKNQAQRRARGVHDRIAEDLEQRLKDKGYSTQRNLHYISRGYYGEFDVYAKKGNVEIYGEVKSRHSLVSWTRAKQQFDRARKAFPDRNLSFIYYTPQLVRRYR